MATYVNDEHEDKPAPEDSEENQSKRYVNEYEPLQSSADTAERGEDAHLIEVLESKPPKRLIPCCCCKFAPGRKYLLWTKRVIMQYVIITLVVAPFKIILIVADLYGEGGFNPKRVKLWTTIVSMVSIIVCLFGLVRFYKVVHDEIEPIQGLYKFISIKGIISCIIFQGLIINVLVSFGVIEGTSSMSADDVATALQNWLLCLETMLAGILHLFVFNAAPYRIYKNLGESFGLGSLISNLGQVLWIGDICREFATALCPCCAGEQEKKVCTMMTE